MGNICNTAPIPEESQVDKLAKIVINMQKHADTNKDGVVSREEMETYMATQMQVREDELARLKRELARVQSAYEALNVKMVESRTTESIKIDHFDSKVDDGAIDAFVQGILDDPNANIYGLPDVIERAMYKRAAKMTLMSLEKIFENLAFEIIGHKLQVIMRPIKEDK
jgi:hypothetical protein